MKNSCVIVSHDNGHLVKKGNLSMVDQSHPVEEIVVADDGSRDGPPQRIRALAGTYLRIKPIIRETNIGVSPIEPSRYGKRAENSATALEGDDYFIATNIEAEVEALRRSFAVIAYSDVKCLSLGDRFRIDEMAVFHYCKPRPSTVGTQQEVRLSKVHAVPKVDSSRDRRQQPRSSDV